MFGPASLSPSSPLPRDCSFPDTMWHAFARQWHPLAGSADVAARPLGGVLLDQRIVLWRTSGGVSAAQDLCIHRGAQLSPGTVVGDELVCPYHGFRYNPSGACTLAPCRGASSAQLPAKLHLRTYTAAEAGGLVWVRMAGEGPASPPVSPACGMVPSAAMEWSTSAQRAVECLIDLGRLDSSRASAWLTEVTGPFSGVVSADAPRGPQAVFAVQPISMKRCRIFLAGPATDEIRPVLEAARPVVESQPMEDGEESLLPEDGAIVVYRTSLSERGLA